MQTSIDDLYINMLPVPHGDHDPTSVKKAVISIISLNSLGIESEVFGGNFLLKCAKAIKVGRYA